MKSLFTFIAGLLITSIVYSQPVFSSGAVPGSNYSVSYQSTFYTGADPSGNTGANFNWDYSTLSFGTSSSRTLSSDISASTYGSQFPTANLYEHTNSNDDLYYIYSTSDQTMLGTYTSGTLIKYSNTQQIITYPINYSDQQSDTYAASFTQSSYPTTLSGTISTSYEGYGSLTLPSETISNIGRIKIVKDETWTTSFATVEIIATTYMWIMPGEVNPRFVIEYVDKYNNGSAFSNDKNAYLYTSVATGTKSPELINATLHPQPAHDQIMIDAPGINGTIQSSIYKTDGTLVKNEELVCTGDGTVSLQVSNIPSGLYFIEMRTADKLVRQKLLVE